MTLRKVDLYYEDAYPWEAEPWRAVARDNLDVEIGYGMGATPTVAFKECAEALQRNRVCIIEDKAEKKRQREERRCPICRSLKMCHCRSAGQ